MTRNQGWVTVGVSVFALLLIVSFISVEGAAAGPEIIVSNESLKPGETILVTVKNLEHVTNDSVVFCEFRGAKNQPLGLNAPMEHKEDVWWCNITAPEDLGSYTIVVIADRNETGPPKKVTVEKSEPSPRGWLRYAVIIAAAALIAILFLFVYFSYFKGEPKMGDLSVQVLDEQGKGVPGAKVIVEWKKNKMPKSGRTSDIGWIEFRLPEGAWCKIKADKEGVGSGKAEIEVSRKGSKAKVTLKSAGAVRKSIVLKVEDENGTKIPDATVRIVKNNEVLRERGTDDWGFCTLEMPEHKEGFLVEVEKDGYERVREPIGKVEQRPIIMMKKKGAWLTLSILDEVNKPVGDVEVLIDNQPFRTNSNGILKVVDVLYGKHKISINKGVYLPYEETVKVEGDTQRKIRLTTKYGGLKVTVLDNVSGEPVNGIEVQAGRLHQETNVDGLVYLDKVPVGQQTVVIRDPSAFYNEEQLRDVEIKKDQITEPSRVRISSSSKILEDKKRNLDDARNQLQAQRGKLPKTTYDYYIPDCYMNIGKKLIKLVSAPNTARIIRGNCKDPSAFMGNLSDVVAAVCLELGKGMNEKRNIDVFGDIKRFVVDKSLAEAPALDDILTEDEIRKCAQGTFNEAVKSNFADVDNRISKMPGNISPSSILFRIAKNVTTWSDRGTKETRTLVALALLNAVVKMIDDPNVKERLRGLIT